MGFYRVSTNATYQLVAPHNKRINAAEKAIRTFKDHFIVGLSSVHKKLPLFLRDELLPQARLTLNLSQKSWTFPKLSAHEHLEGIFNFASTPLAPPEFQALIFVDPNKQKAYGPHGENAFYLGPALEHYQCFRFYVPATGKIIISGTAQFFLNDETKIINPPNSILTAETQLIDALQHPSPIIQPSIKRPLSRTPENVPNL